MTMKIKLLIAAFFVFPIIFVSCGGKKGNSYSLEDTPPIIIDVDSIKKEPLKISKLKYIPLETTSECIIGYADKVLIKNDKLYVADITQADALFVFDLNGKFLFKIAKKGNGPGEYVTFMDFDVLPNGDIYMWDISTKKIIVYDQSGEYKKDIKIPRMSNFYVLENKIYLSRVSGLKGDISVNLAVYNMDNEKIDTILKNDEPIDNISLPNHSGNYGFYQSPSNIYYSPKFSPIIYSIDKDGVRPAIGIKNLNMPTKAIVDEWLKSGNIFADTKSGYFLENARIYETDRHIAFVCVVGHFSDVYMYDKHTQHVCRYDMSESIGASDVSGSTGKEFFSVVNFWLRSEAHKKILETYEELANWKEDDNPVIAIFNLE